MKILFIDTETSGLPKDYNLPCTAIDNWPRTVQIAWKILGDETVTNHLIYPTSREPIDGVPVHGITREKLRKDGSDIVQVLTSLNKILEEIDYVCAHNAEFDICVLLAEYYRYGIKTTLDTKPVFDTMRVDGSHRWFTLQESYAKFVNPDLSCIKWHDAEGDVLACEAVYAELSKKKLLSGPFFFAEVK